MSDPNRPSFGVDVSGKDFKIDIENIFDSTLPDYVPPPITEFTEVGENGEIIYGENHHYNPYFNHHKVREYVWNHFNNKGKASINHAFGGYCNETLYQHWSHKMDVREWMELKMWLITQLLWYNEDYSNPIELDK